jgi:di/tripeptidase
MKRLVAALGIASVAAFSSGCATEGAARFGGSTTPEYDAKFGDSVRQARALQTMNSEAGRDGAPVIGIDGRAGAAAMERYQDSFRAPPRTFEVLNIGGAGSQ